MSSRRAVLATFLRLLWLLTCLLLLLGAFTPMFTFSKFFVFNDTFSLWAATVHLWVSGQRGLFLLIFVFSLLIPALKMLTLWSLMKPAQDLAAWQRRHGALSVLGKWSMLDVFVVAVLVVTVKLKAIASIEVHSGLYLFASGVLGSMVLTQLVGLLAPVPGQRKR